MGTSRLPVARCQNVLLSQPLVRWLTLNGLRLVRPTKTNPDLSPPLYMWKRCVLSTGLVITGTFVSAEDSRVMGRFPSGPQHNCFFSFFFNNVCQYFIFKWRCFL